MKDLITTMAVSEYLSNIKNNCGGYHKKQEDFAYRVIEEFLNSGNKNKITVFPDRCGLGKSTLLKSFIHNFALEPFIGFGDSNIVNKMPHGAIIVTDRLEQLEKILNYKNLKKVCYLFKYDKEDIESKNRMSFIEQMQQAYTYPVILISTQKYFSLEESQRIRLYTYGWSEWNSKSKKYELTKKSREICIIDEKPIITNNITIDEEYLSKIGIAIDNSFENKQKQYLIDTWKKIKNDIDYIRDTYSKGYEVMWIKKQKQCLLVNETEDKRFLDELANNVSTAIYQNVLNIREIYRQGGLFVNKKSKDQPNKRYIIHLQNNIDKFDLNKCKYYILDATAYFDIDYQINKNIMDYKIGDNKKDESDIRLFYVDVGASKNSIDADKVKSISNWIKTFNLNDTFICTYGDKSGIRQQFQRELNYYDIGYFGNIKGKNDFEDRHNCIHIGFNRKADYVYLQTYILLERVHEKWNSKNITDEEIHKEIEKILEMKKGRFINETMDSIMKNNIVVDMEQNVMRIKCRHFNNTDICKIYILCNYKNYKDIVSMIAQRLDVIVEEAEATEIKKHKADIRKNRSKAYEAWSLWLINQPKDREFKLADIYAETTLTDKRLKELKKQNTYVREWFSTHKLRRDNYKI